MGDHRSVVSDTRHRVTRTARDSADQHAPRQLRKPSSFGHRHWPIRPAAPACLDSTDPRCLLYHKRRESSSAGRLAQVLPHELSPRSRSGLARISFAEFSLFVPLMFWCFPRPARFAVANQFQVRTSYRVGVPELFCRQPACGDQCPHTLARHAEFGRDLGCCEYVLHGLS